MTVHGLVDLEVALPGGTVDIGEVAARAGVPLADALRITHCRRFPALGPGERSVDVALHAARTLLKRTAVDVDGIDLVLWAGSAEWDVPFWSPAAHVAGELGITGAHCFEVANFCNAGSTALQIGLDRLALGRAGSVLVVMADRLSTMLDQDDPMSKELFNFGDAAAVALLGPDPLFTVPASRMRTDPDWSSYYHGEYRDDRLVIRREAHRSGLASAYVANFTALTADVLDALGRTVDDVDWFLINHGDRDMHVRLLGELGIPGSRSVFNYDHLAHMGASDTLIALRGLLDDDALRPGDLLLLATSAMGFSWGITALRYEGGGHDGPGGRR
ncbi:3-oxoacyl-ACP synthase III family protein [Streptomyces sp. DT24]|uniref:3-oxoacyl-ACP synthase III family protein n=1 Tax=unclassified Streptomyces TaxID=2593676 RepID=UPI0023B91E31|nr:3-oxoacyl-[acyl-carrier-protein] synthase III C-terminal domain-containing protein [Streptomyces sp. AM 4-1-1]WEH34976.1 3-oxoacyl-[acyl-carrier-protein] synthase III C-terminal domain-containing protein [Streptomyces sp. AM 4-1-1]